MISSPEQDILQTLSNLRQFNPPKRWRGQVWLPTRSSLAPLPPLQTQSKKLIFIVSQCKTTCQNNHVSANLIFLTISVVLCKTKPRFPPLSDNSLTVLSSVTRQHVGTALSPALATPDCSVNNNNPEPHFQTFSTYSFIFIALMALKIWI